MDAERLNDLKQRAERAQQLATELEMLDDSLGCIEDVRWKARHSAEAILAEQLLHDVIRSGVQVEIEKRDKMLRELLGERDPNDKQVNPSEDGNPEWATAPNFADIG
jgi:hypothetical protein